MVRVFSEQASGIHENRKQLSALLKLSEERQMERVLIEFPDRLARFGYRYLERFLNSHGVAVEATHKTEPKSSQEELVQDLLTIVTVFSPGCTANDRRSSDKGQKAHGRDEWR